MTRAPLIAVLLAAAGLMGCPGADENPCDFKSSGARWLAFSSHEGGSWDIHVVRADGTCRRALTHDAEFDTNPAWTPNGVVAFESDRGAHTGIWLASLDSGGLRQLDTGGLVAVSPAVSPDGSLIAFEGRYAGSTTNSIYVVPAAGGTPRELTPEAVPHGNGGPAFAPDGRAVYFVSNRRGPNEIYRVPLAGSLDPEKVTTGSRILGKPAVSPDGKTIAYTRQITSTTWEVLLYDPAHATSVALGIPQATEPAFDPAGGRLVVRADYATATGLTTNLDLVPLPPAGSFRLTTGPGPDGAPAFDR